MPDRSYKLTYTVEDNGSILRLKGIRDGIELIDQSAMKGAARLKALDQALVDVGTQATLTGIQIGKINDAIGHMSSGLGGLLPGWQIFEYGVQLAQTFGEYMNSAREHMRELAKEAQETRDKMRELANLKGHFGPDNEVVGETVKMGMEAGMSIKDSTKFLEQFEGSIPAGRAKENIDQSIERDLAIEGMRFGNRVGLQPGTSGDITGVLPQYAKVGSVVDGAGQLGMIAHGLNEGRGNLEPLMRSLLKTAGATVEQHGGPVEDLPELAAILGVASTNATPDRAGTMIKNSINAVRKFKGPQGDTLKELGITPEMKFHQALDLIAPKILEADASGKGGDTFLRGAGFDNEDEIRGLVQLSRNKKVIDKRLEDAKSLSAGKEVMAANQKFLTQDRAGIARGIKSRQEGMDFLTGEGKEFSEMGIEAGSMQLREDGMAGGFGNKARHFFGDLGGMLPAVGFEETRTVEAKQKFMDMLRAEGKRVGVDVVLPFRKSGKHGEMKDSKNDFSYQNQREALFNDSANLNLAIEQVMQAGGNPFGDSVNVSKRFDTLIDHDKEHRKRLDQIPAGRGARPGAGPRPGAAAPGAAGGPPPGQGPGPGADLGGKLDKLVAATEQTNRLLDGKLVASNLPEGAGPVGAARL